jgi:hypothetical protein
MESLMNGRRAVLKFMHTERIENAGMLDLWCEWLKQQFQDDLADFDKWLEERKNDNKR